ncbi:unnamed protein product [Arctia plantaginis]|uniref:Gustatory receptor n=1 Tax=Arctia plantaginis TaxID=874455 RepID=A0A8S1BK38_ARCPL|nr:unnamed protein product [Arctia plantaginis]CAB3258763.1 unnamed protein product [Arctia plantaginis]
MVASITSCVRSALSIRALMFVRLMTGLYFCVSSVRFVTLVARLYVVFYVTVQLQYYSNVVFDADFRTIIDYGFMLFQFIVTALVNFLLDGEYIFNFLREIRKIDYSMNNVVNDEIPMFRVILIFVILVKICVAITGCFIHKLYRSWRFFITYYVPTTSVAFTNVTRIMMFESLCHRMKAVRKRLERELSVAHRVEEGDDAMVHNLRNCMIIYKNILNTVHETEMPMKILVYALPAIFNTCLDTTYPFLPGIFVDMVNKEVDRMVLAVAKQLLVCRGTHWCNALKDAVQYLGVRRFRYTVWRVVSIDSSLVLSTASVATTYVLAMLQFMHIYN